MANQKRHTPHFPRRSVGIGRLTGHFQDYARAERENCGSSGPLDTLRFRVEKNLYMKINRALQCFHEKSVAYPNICLGVYLTSPNRDIEGYHSNKDSNNLFLTSCNVRKCRIKINERFYLWESYAGGKQRKGS